MEMKRSRYMETDGNEEIKIYERGRAIGHTPFRFEQAILFVIPLD